MHQELLVSTGIVGALTLSSATGRALRLRAREPATIAIVDNLNARIRSWWIICAILGAAFWAGNAAILALFGVISLFALREFLTLAAVEAPDHRAVIACFVVAIPLQYWLIGSARINGFMISIPLLAILAGPAIMLLSARSKNFLARAAELSLGLMLCVYCIAHVPALLMLPVANAKNLVIFIILITQSSDILQYIFGKVFGRHKLAPEISPSKTMEGAIGGLAGATALGPVLCRLTPFSPVESGVVALVIALAACVGGLTMSAIKRDRRVKDWSNLIPGHGGMLDRIDSLCFAGPVFFHLTRYFLNV